MPRCAFSFKTQNVTTSWFMIPPLKRGMSFIFGLENYLRLSGGENNCRGFEYRRKIHFILASFSLSLWYTHTRWCVKPAVKIKALTLLQVLWVWSDVIFQNRILQQLWKMFLLLILGPKLLVPGLLKTYQFNEFQKKIPPFWPKKWYFFTSIFGQI